MKRDTESSTSPQPDAAPTLGRWSALSDALIHGLAHSLSNRVGALMALAHTEPGEPTAREAAILEAEVNRLVEINRLLKLLPAGRSSRREGLLVEDVLADATALLALHPQLRDVAYEVESADVQPVRMERWALLRLLLLLLEAAGVNAEEHRVIVTTSGDDERVTVLMRAIAPVSNAQARIAAREPDVATLLARVGATLTQEPTGAVLVLPTITAARRSEGRSSAPA